MLKRFFFFFITGFEQFDDNVLWYSFYLVLVLRVIELLGSEGLLISLNLEKICWLVFQIFFCALLFLFEFSIPVYCRCSCLLAQSCPTLCDPRGL